MADKEIVVNNDSQAADNDLVVVYDSQAAISPSPSPVQPQMALSVDVQMSESSGPRKRVHSDVDGSSSSADELVFRRPVALVPAVRKAAKKQSPQPQRSRSNSRSRSPSPAGSAVHKHLPASVSSVPSSGRRPKP